MSDLTCNCGVFLPNSALLMKTNGQLPLQWIISTGKSFPIFKLVEPFLKISIRILISFLRVFETSGWEYIRSDGVGPNVIRGPCVPLSEAEKAWQNGRGWARRCGNTVLTNLSSHFPNFHWELQLGCQASSMELNNFGCFRQIDCLPLLIGGWIYFGTVWEHFISVAKAPERPQKTKSWTIQLWVMNSISLFGAIVVILLWKSIWLKQRFWAFVLETLGV